MRLHSLRLRCFRNYGALDFDGDADIHLIVGQNAQGKSNLLEAIYLLATGRSFRTHSEGELLQWGEDAALIVGRFQRRTTEAEVRIELQAARAKQVRVSGEPLRRLSDLYGIFNAVLFTPDDLQLVKGGPERRRRFLDTVLYQVSAAYRQESLRYHRVLKQRNSVLSNMVDGRGDPALLAAFTEQLSDAGAHVIARRATALRELEAAAAEAYAQISRDREHLSVCYRPSFCKDVEPLAESPESWRSVADMRARLASEAERLSRAEQIRGQTLFGPQRDDLVFLLDARDARAFASQGQQRSITLALKQAEVAFLEAQSGEPPVLLLDDVLSELDHERRVHLLAGISREVQTFVTTTHIEPFAAWANRPLCAYRVEAGKLNRIEPEPSG